jgi:hypothetical protein
MKTSTAEKPSYVLRATAAYEGAPEEWILALAEACDRESQSAAARKIGMSLTTVSEVLANKYKADPKRVRETVMGALMGSTVSCPVLGDDLPRDRCIIFQKQDFAASNPQRVQLWRACPTCKNYRGQRKAAASSPDLTKPEE